MGHMYTNITLAGPDLSAVEELLRRAGRTAYVLVRPGFWVVYDKASEQQDGTVESLARQIAAGIGCSALAVTNHDDDVLERGRLIPITRDRGIGTGMAKA